jgi:hypothetical protein
LAALSSNRDNVAEPYLSLPQAAIHLRTDGLKMGKKASVLRRHLSRVGVTMIYDLKKNAPDKPASAIPE